MRPTLTTLAVACAGLVALAAVPSGTADPLVSPCTGPNEAVIDDVTDTLADPTHPECGSLTRPCFTQGWSCYGCGPDIVEWVIGPIYCATALPPGPPCDGPNESVKDDVYDTVFADPADPQCGSLSDPCYDDEPYECAGCGPGLVEWIIGPIECP
jgi:hypothetical protein